VGKLQGKVAVITRGTTGIGFAAAKIFVEEGAYVFITGRRQKELDEAVKAIGANVTGVQGDVSKLADLDRLYETINAEGRRIDVVFANAGLGEFAALGSVTEEHFDRLFNINVKGALFTVQKALPLLNDGGSIVLTGSVASAKGTPAFWVYGATKAAIQLDDVQAAIIVGTVDQTVGADEDVGGLEIKSTVVRVGSLSTSDLATEF
jgi:NAD(P)-dependent dehydrogenase (short-subunit alcohol dehydrogenase family)